jgi:hypothetical protein
MPTITMMPSGINAAFAGGNKAPPVRGTCRGLTQGSARRCKAFLMSIDTNKLSGIPINFTLTLKDCPPSSDEWERLKKEFFRRLKKMGLIRLHFVTEWTKRGLPHLHGMGFFHRIFEASENVGGQWERYHTTICCHYIEKAWCDVATSYGAKEQGQHSRQETSINVAWFKYMSKHASRSANHYQRQRDQMPEGWLTTGRMWGKLGNDWLTHSESHEIADNAFHHLRRQVRSFRRSQALTEIKKGKLWGNPHQVRGGLATLAYLRGLKKITDPARSSRIPINEWVSAEMATTLLEGIHINIEPKPRRDYRAIAKPHQAPKQEPTGLAQRALAAVGQGRPIRASVGASQEATASSASAVEPPTHQLASCSPQGRTEVRTIKSLIYGIR